MNFFEALNLVVAAGAYRPLLRDRDRRRQHLVAVGAEPLAERLVEDLSGRRQLDVILAGFELGAIDQALERLGVVGIIVEDVNRLRVLLER